MHFHSVIYTILHHAALHAADLERALSHENVTLHICVMLPMLILLHFLVCMTGLLLDGACWWRTISLTLIKMLNKQMQLICERNGKIFFNFSIDEKKKIFFQEIEKN